MPWANSSGRRQRVTAAPRNRHGMSPGELAAMLERQGGRCLICGRAIDERTMIVDHDHALAEIHGHRGNEGCKRCVRGLLDTRCNTLLGYVQDDPATLRRAAAYVELARESKR